MKRQGRHILLLLDNCPSHPDIKLSNVKLQFLPKNTTSELQPLDRGVIAWVKSYYKRLLMSTLQRAMKDSRDIVDLVKNVKIYPAVVNTIAVWDKLPSETIVKCFNRCGTVPGFKDSQDQEPTIEQNHEIDDFDRWFGELLEVPWDEYLAYDDELEVELPSRAPDAQPYNAIDQDQEDNEHEETEEIKLNTESVLDQLENMRSYFMGDNEQFKLVNQLYSNVYASKVQEELRGKSKQTEITSFFKSQ